MKKQCTGQEKMFANHTSDMGLEAEKGKKKKNSPLLPLESNSEF